MKKIPTLFERVYEKSKPSIVIDNVKLGLDMDTLYRHGVEKICVPRNFEGLREYLKEHEIEGIVFWKDGEPQCKIKRTDFGLRWPVRK